MPFSTQTQKTQTNDTKRKRFNNQLASEWAAASSSEKVEIQRFHAELCSFILYFIIVISNYGEIFFKVALLNVVLPIFNSLRDVCDNFDTWSSSRPSISNMISGETLAISDFSFSSLLSFSSITTDVWTFSMFFFLNSLVRLESTIVRETS